MVTIGKQFMVTLEQVTASEAAWGTLSVARLEVTIDHSSGVGRMCTSKVTRLAGCFLPQSSKFQQSGRGRHRPLYGVAQPPFSPGTRNDRKCHPVCIVQC